MDLILTSRRDYIHLHLFVFSVFFLSVLSYEKVLLSAVYLCDGSLPEIATDELPNIGKEHCLVLWLHSFPVQEVESDGLMRHIVKYELL